MMRAQARHHEAMEPPGQLELLPREEVYATDAAVSLDPSVVRAGVDWTVATVGLGLSCWAWILILWSGPFALVAAAWAAWPLDSFSRLSVVLVVTMGGAGLSMSAGSCLAWLAKGVIRRTRRRLTLATALFGLGTLALMALVPASSTNLTLVAQLFTLTSISAVLTLCLAATTVHAWRTHDAERRPEDR
jgi:hypothetical protein